MTQLEKYKEILKSENLTKELRESLKRKIEILEKTKEVLK